VNFRLDEARALLDTSTAELVLGRGLGGRYVGKDVNGRRVVTGWTHTFPLWIVLKGGVIALTCCLMLCALLGRNVLARLAIDRARERAVLGTLLVSGVLLMSLTLGRAALIEGAFFMLVGAGLIGIAPVRETA
jgi:hypothetical protein